MVVYCSLSCICGQLAGGRRLGDVGWLQLHLKVNWPLGELPGSPLLSLSAAALGLFTR